PHGGAWRRPAQRAVDSGPRRHLHNAGLHAPGTGTAQGGAPQTPSPRSIETGDRSIYLASIWGTATRCFAAQEGGCPCKHGEGAGMSTASVQAIDPRLDDLVNGFLKVLTNERGASAHTLRAYQRELHGFAAWVNGHYEAEQSADQNVDQSVQRIEHTDIRAYLGTLYDRGLSKASAARALAAIRSWFKWLARTGHVEQNVASLVSTPRLPKHLPRVPSIEQMNRVVDSVGADAASWPARDKAILEMLYGCGIRNAELTALDLQDIHWANEVILVRGKGQKQRYVPLGDAAAQALRAYLGERSALLAAGDASHARATAALFVNLRLRGLAK